MIITKSRSYKIYQKASLDLYPLKYFINVNFKKIIPIVMTFFFFVCVVICRVKDICNLLNNYVAFLKNTCISII
jgi:hypothetical protein